MIIEIKKSIKPVKYENAITFLEKRLDEIHAKKRNELIWVLEHKDVYTAGTNYKDNELLDKSVNLIKSNSCLLYTSPSPRDRTRSRMPSSA